MCGKRRLKKLACTASEYKSPSRQAIASFKILVNDIELTQIGLHVGPRNIANSPSYSLVTDSQYRLSLIYVRSVSLRPLNPTNHRYVHMRTL